ncbi:MAG TPA: hypothetical protein VHR72_06635 [Gemmataceae bacterium]|jgi:hypothetical protein|nr:hypothetical protein [Gemmataceae bacterium]
MRIRRPNLFVLGGLLVVSLLATAAILIVHVPTFHIRADEPAGNSRDEASSEFFLRASSFLATFSGGKGQWTYSFTQKQFNSFFQEDFIRFGDADRFRNVGFTEPRVEFDEDRIRLAFRYGEGKWSTILSYEVKAWVSSSEPNVIVVEFLRCRAGALPAPTQQVFQELTELAQQHNIDIDWYRHATHPVAVVHFQVDRARPTAQISSLKASPGKLTITGVTFDPLQSPIEGLPQTPATPVSAPKGPVPAVPASKSS